jgi:hypothetical protein
MSDAKPVIFISYSHRDEPDKSPGGETWWLTYVQSHLQPAVKGDIFDLWTDYDIDGGADWRAAIDRKLNDCDIFILLVSRHSVSSDFICGVEVDRMLARRREDELNFYPIVLSPFATSAVPWLMGMNLMPREGKPLSTLANSDRDVAMVEIVEEIAAKARDIAEKKRASQTRFSIRARTTDSATSLGRVRVATVDIAHLPETAYENLVGRAVELKRLNVAWSDRNTNILSLIAEGGAGKSALVNEWLKGMLAENYRGADAVLGWSFYSQGTKERATSAEQFLNWAVEKLGIKVETKSAIAKGEAIAEELTKRRVLLVLDGCEPLQHGLDKQQGELKDQGLRALLRRFAITSPAHAHGLVVLTSRLPIKDIARWKESSAQVIDVGELSDVAGAALLRDNGAWGTDKELRTASRDFGGHPLALGLLASYLKEKHFGDVRQRDRVRGLLHDEENPRHDHARRVMESYETEWLATRPIEHAIMHMVGLFDRPASGDCLRALRQKPAIVGLTEAIVGLDEGEWRRAVARLREAKLLSPVDLAAPEALDAHPLVREWFGERSKLEKDGAWKSAHVRLFEHLCDTTREKNTPTLEDIAPLYQAVAHGCKGGQYVEAFKVYHDRICRNAGGANVFYAATVLCAFGSNLAAISNFFEQPYAEPLTSLQANLKPWILNEAASCLIAQSRFSEADAALRAAAKMYERMEMWTHAAVVEGNLTELELLLGNVAQARLIGAKAVEDSDRGDLGFVQMSTRAIFARVLDASGQFTHAKQLFTDAERRQSEQQPAYPLLYSLQGFFYCDFLLRFDGAVGVQDRVAKTITWAMKALIRRDVALGLLILVRSNLVKVLSKTLGGQEISPAAATYTQLEQAAEFLRGAGEVQLLPYYLLTRAAFYRGVADWDNAMRDLDEVEEIAEPGPMKLFLCDAALERTRLAFAKKEAFAPLNGQIDNSRPIVPDAIKAAQLNEAATDQLAVAAGYIKTCGYHRRDEELAELQAVLRGEKKFADLPPRV